MIALCRPSRPGDRGASEARRSTGRWHLVVLLLLPLLVCVAEPAVAQNYQFRHYTSANGLPQQRVFSVFQDREGYAWFGTEGGIARYDGARFETFGPRRGLASNRVTAITEDASGRVLVGTVAGLSVFESDGFRSLKLFKPYNAYIRALYSDVDGGVWVATDRDLHLLYPHDPERASQAYLGVRARVVFRDARRRLWIGSDRGLLQLVDGEPVPSGEGVAAGADVLTIVEDQEGNLWLGTDEGLYRGNGERFAPVADSVMASPRAKVINQGVVDPEGVLWFGAWGGVVRIDRGRVQLITEAQGLPNSNVRATFVDREGNLWFGTDDGVAKLVPGPFTSFTSSEGLPGDSIGALAEDTDGRIWVTTDRGVGIIEPDGRVWRLGARHRFPPNTRPKTVAALADGSVLIGTRRGLFRWRERTVELYEGGRALPTDAVASLLVSQSGEVWVGLQSGLARFSGGELDNVPEAGPLGEVAVTALAEDSEGGLWIASDRGGLFLLDRSSESSSESSSDHGSDRSSDDRRARLQQIELSAEGSSVWALAPDPSGGMWVGTNGAGAFLMQPDAQVEQLSTRNSLANDFVRQILVDREARIWLYTNRGLDRLDSEGVVTHFDAGDGLIDLEGIPGAVLEDSSGNLWFGTARGLMRYAPERDRLVDVPPLVHLTNVSIGETAYSPADRLTISFSRSRYTFDFAGLAFRDEQDNAFRYRLVGLSDAWSQPTSERQISYANLPPNNYTFEVQARNAQGLWSRVPARFVFEVQPVFYQTLMFRAAMVVLALVAVAEVYWLRNRYVERERLKLAREVEARTQELVRETHQRKVVEDQVEFMTEHDPLTGLANRKLFRRQLEQALQYASRRQELSVVFYLDIDRFRRINDAYGYGVGDDVLRTVAHRLLECVRNVGRTASLGDEVEGTVARMEGDEFAALLVGFRNVLGIRTTARRMLKAVAEPTSNSGEELVTTASVGITVVVDGKADLPSQLRDARAAMLHVKRAGGNAYALFGPEMRSDAQGRLSMENQLHKALEREEFELRYQPIIDLRSGHMNGVEALLRWNSPRFGRVTPEVFIPIAEEVGLISAISDWVLRRACRDGKAWSPAGSDWPRVAVNFSAHHFRQPRLVESIVAILADVDFDPSLLEIELTENALIEDTYAIVGTLRRLRRIGISLSVDDFGTGYSSLSYLSRFPINTLKIDRSFVGRLELEENCSIISAIVAMAHGLNMRVVGEGVESNEQLEFLRAQGCDEVQGYLFGWPLRAVEIDKLLRDPTERLRFQGGDAGQRAHGRSGLRIAE